MKRLLGWALAVSSLSWIASAEAAPVPMLDCNGLPCVTVKIGNRKPIKLAIDTGDVNTFLDKDVSRALGLAVEPIIVLTESQRPAL